MDTPRDFDAVCAAVADPDDPFHRFVAALEPDGGIPAPYRRIAAQSSAIAFRVAEPGTWTRAHSQFEVAVGLGVRPEAVVTLPDHFTSSSAAAAVAARVGRDNVFHVRRLRHMVAIVLDLVLLGRMALMRHVRERLGFLPDRIAFTVSYEDVCDEPDVLTLSRPLGRANVLLPDPFYFDSGAYERHKLSVLAAGRPWAERSDIVVWRGSTTGSRFGLDDLLRNERIALAAACAGRPDVFDVRITGVVQARPGEAEAVAAALETRGLLGPWVPFDDFAERKFAVHIDGNSSAAGFFEKLCLGCCVLRVESGFQQWFEARIAPWIHYVPVRPDASDILEKALFLRANPDLAERIAQAGFAFALEADVHAEARLFVRELAASLAVERFRSVLRAPGLPEVGRDGWHGLEHDPAGTGYRWTGLTEVSWHLDLPTPVTGPSLLVVEIPFHREIRPGFAAGCRVLLGDRCHPVQVAGDRLRAELPVPSDRPLRLVLRTPPPLVPAQACDSCDTRALGLAVRVD